MLTLLSITVAAGLTLTLQLGWHIGLDGIRGPSALGAPPPVPTGEGGYAFTRTQPLDHDRPVTYSPCRAIHVVINDAQAPGGSTGVVEEALARVSELTGLRFTVDGTTDESPGTRARHAEQPVLIAWTTPSEVADLEGDVAGLGGSTSVASSSLTPIERYASGQVSLDAPQLAEVIERPEGRNQVRAIVMHELGHLVGLDHVNDPAQLMFAKNSGATDFGDGDKRGLALLGQGSCRDLG